ncbi:MAG TPA: tetratricopeptide repeat protein, partial [Acidimicrobiia bacterium]
ARHVAWATLVAVVVVGFSVGRFVLYEPAPTAETAPPRVALSPSAQVARLERAVRRDRQDVRSLQQLAAAYVQRALQTADPSFYDLSQRALDRADAIAPDQDQTLLTRAVLDLSRHDFAGALALGDRVHERDPARADALAVLVDASVELGHYDAADAYLQDLLDRRPGLPAYSRLSYLRELHGDDAGAVIAMREALVAGGGAFDDATITTFLGDLAFAQGRTAEAAGEYDDALRRTPGLPLAELGHARTLAASGRRAEAITALEHLTRRVPLPAAVALLGDLQADAGLAADAARSYELVRSITRLQEASGQVTDLELAVFEADHAPGAVAVDRARRAYEARPDNVYTADAFAWALVRAGDAAGARPLVDRALRLGTADALVHYHAAVVLDATGERASAASELQAAFARNPWFSFLHRADATTLAGRLGVPVPSAWSAR